VTINSEGSYTSKDFPSTGPSIPSKGKRDEKAYNKAKKDLIGLKKKR
jgi:hypothetical protein